MLYVVPIEPLEERYSAQWLIWTQRELERLIPGRFEVLIPAKWIMNYRKISQGSFLDVCKTHVYKFTQLQMISQLLAQGMIKDGDVFWFHDLWFPGLEALAYMRQGTGIDFKIAGCLHAGTYDPHDFLSKKGMGTWGEPLENSWFNFVDFVFVATNFHKSLLTLHRQVDPDKVHVTGFPIHMDPSWTLDGAFEKRDWVVFPHRLDEEKQPHLFDSLAQKCADIPDTGLNALEFIKTKQQCETKQQYYSILSTSKFAVSFALQETWGIAMQESLFCGCVPIVPHRLSYVDMYDLLFQFDGTVMGCVDKLYELMHMPKDELNDALFWQTKRLLNSGFMAIPLMLEKMGVR